MCKYSFFYKSRAITFEKLHKQFGFVITGYNSITDHSADMHVK